MVQVRKCQSKKHGFGGCGDPRCPEGLSIQKAMDSAVANENFQEFFAARSLKDVKPTMLFNEQGFNNLWVVDKNDDESHNLRFVSDRPEVQKAVSEMDRTTILSFNTLSELTTFINDTYRPYAHYDVREYTEEATGLQRLSVARMDVDADLRGQGIGKYFRDTLTKYADEHNCILTGTPTNSGDGSMEHTNENTAEYKAHALAHRARLIRFYLRHGYEYNYAYRPMGNGKDYWTGERYPENPEWVAQLNERGRRFLEESGFYIRWPNGAIPKQFRARKSRAV